MKKKLLLTVLNVTLVLMCLLFPLKANAALNSTTTDFFITSTGTDTCLGENYSFSIDNSTNPKSMNFYGTTRKSYLACKVYIYEIYSNEYGKLKTRLTLSPSFAMDHTNSFRYTIDLSALCNQGTTYILRPVFAESRTEDGEDYAFAPGSFTMAGAKMRYSNDSMYFLRFKEIEDQNLKIKANSSHILLENYLDVYMRDSFETNYGLNEEDVQELTQFAKQLIQENNAVTDYEKLLCFHDFITQNFYYDSYARSTGLEKNLNPITLLHDYLSQGKTKTVCNGFSAFFQVLARIEGIPCRTASGHNLLLPLESWDTEANIDSVDHVWNEAYVDADKDGRKEWITIDCNSDCANTYGINSGYVRPAYPIFRYTFFNPSEQLLAINHRYLRYREVDGNYMKPRIISRKCVNGKIRLTWKLSYKSSSEEFTDAQLNNLAAYVLYRRTSSSSWQAIDTIQTSNTTFTYTDTTAAANVLYQYRLAAVAKSDGSTGYPWLYRTALALNTPKIQALNPIGKISYLTWSKVEGATAYNVYMKIGENNPLTGEKKEFVLVDTVDSSANYAYLDMTEALSGEMASFKITAIKKIGSSTYRSDFSSKRSGVKLDSPQIISLVHSMETNSNLLSFTSVTGADKYLIFKSETQEGPYTQVAELTDLTNLTYLDSQLEDQKTYFYKVKATCLKYGTVSVSEDSLIQSFLPLVPIAPNIQKH
ncbi:MAG: transglutaminase-like domain-containing protein [Lachnospiraceae bacterium]